MTPFGKAVRKLRIDRDLLLKDMADELGVTPTFLSAVETGRKPIPAGWLDRVATILNLNMIERRELDEAAARSAQVVRIQVPQSTSDLGRSVAAMLARSFGDLDDDKMREIKEILDRRKA